MQKMLCMFVFWQRHLFNCNVLRYKKHFAFCIYLHYIIVCPICQLVNIYDSKIGNSRIPRFLQEKHCFENISIPQTLCDFFSGGREVDRAATCFNLEVYCGVVITTML